MTSPVKIAANRLNAQLSTGPRTDAGKRTSSRNATTHGVFSTCLLPGESPTDWLCHRESVLLGLRGKGRIEELYAERIALADWRLQRIHRYQRHLAERQLIGLGVAKHRELAVQLDQLREEIRQRRQHRDSDAELAESLRQVLTGPVDTECTSGEAQDILSFTAEVLQTDTGDDAATVELTDRRLLKRLGCDPDAGVLAYERDDWTHGRVRKGVKHLAGRYDLTLEEFATLLQKSAAANEKRCTRQLSTLKTQRNQLKKQLRKLERRLSAQVALPADAELNRLIHYEAHLVKMGQKALAELERVQRLRGVKFPGEEPKTRGESTPKKTMPSPLLSRFNGASMSSLLAGSKN